MVKAVLFDLDGTLLDTVEDIRACVNAMLKKFGYPQVSREVVFRSIGDGVRELVERVVPADAKNKEECLSYFSGLYAGGDNRYTRVFEGEKEFLLRLAARGVKLAVITNKMQSAADNCISQFLSEIPFDFIGGETGMFPCKPDPSLALYAALKMHVPPAACAFVGDGEPDARTAINAGMFGVSCLWGYRTREQLEKAGAVRFAHSFDELEKILENA